MRINGIITSKCIIFIKGEFYMSTVRNNDKKNSNVSIFIYIALGGILFLLDKHYFHFFG